MLNEDSVRAWMKKTFPNEVEWIAFNYGGTAGLADCVLTIADWRIPIELKFWKRDERGWVCKIRPAQRRYHMVAARQGVRTAFIVGSAVATCERGDSVLALQMFPGTKTPRSERALMPLGMCDIGRADEDPAPLRQRVIELLKDKDFW
jgi:hypothetical protein